MFPAHSSRKFLSWFLNQVLVSSTLLANALPLGTITAEIRANRPSFTLCHYLITLLFLIQKFGRFYARSLSFCLECRRKDLVVLVKDLLLLCFTDGVGKIGISPIHGMIDRLVLRLCKASAYLLAVDFIIPR